MPNARIDATQLFLLQRLKSALLWCIYAFHYYIIIKLQQLVASRTIRGSSITPRDLECMLCDETADPTALPLSLLEEITEGFSNEQEIGRGAFAVVYKGKLENRTAAVKKMSIPYKYEEFHREIECLMMAKHKNVVRFLGYCADTQGTMAMHEGKFVMADVQQKLLCFEYLPKGSLHEYITGRNIPAMYELHFVVPMAGAVICTLNSRLDAAMAAVLLRHSEARVIFIDDALLEVAQEAICLVSAAGARAPVAVLIKEFLDDDDNTSSSGIEHEYEALVSRGGSPEFACGGRRTRMTRSR